MYNICLVGLGKISRKHIIAINSIKQFNLYAVCDVNKKNYLALNSRSVRYYKDYKQALKDKNIDIVDICTPSGMHPSMIIQAARAKKNIIAEKPLALKAREGAKAIEAAKKNKVKLFVVRQNRYNLPVMAVKTLAALEYCSPKAARAGAHPAIRAAGLFWAYPLASLAIVSAGTVLMASAH